MATTTSLNKPLASPVKTDSIQWTARITGLLFLIMAVIAPFGMIYVPSTMLVPGDAAATAGNVVASESLFRLGMLGDSLVFLIEIALSVLLYVLLRPVSKTLAMIAGLSRLTMAVIQGVNLLTQFLVLLLLSGAGYLSAFEPGQTQALALLFVEAHQSVVLIWGLSFGLHLLVMGYLVYRSRYIARGVGVLVVVAGLCYLVQSFGNMLFPAYAAIFTMVGALAVTEAAMPLWLVFKGVNVEQWQKRALAPA